MAICDISTVVICEGVQPHFCPWKNVCFPIFPHGEKWEKSIWKEREKYSFPSLSIYFFPHLSPWEKWENTHFFMGKMGLDPLTDYNVIPPICVSVHKLKLKRLVENLRTYFELVNMK